jgi:4-carboxymuconolactone decarboxylase
VPPGDPPPVRAPAAGAPVPTPPLRLGPLPDADLTSEQRAVVDDLVQGPTVNIYRSIVRDPKAAAAMVNLGRTLRAEGLSPRHREILILRTGWLCQSAYELAQHYRAGVAAGLSAADIERVRLGPDAPGWDSFEAALCRAADELHAFNAVSDGTWSTLSSQLDEAQLVHTVMLIGYYHLVSFVLNALGVPVEEGTPPFPTA